ncbi:MAG: hypothetical protein WC326_03105 [Candidatus Delongbacteria bacterium]
MSLSTIMSHAGYSGYAIIGMIFFLLVFASLMIRLWLQSRAGGLEEVGRLPLEEARPEAASGTIPAQPAQPAAGKLEERR